MPRPFATLDLQDALWPPMAGWLDEGNCTPLGYRIVRRAFCDVGIGERPKGSNRSGRIDTYLRRGGVSEKDIKDGKGYWCAAWTGSVWADCGIVMPKYYADCDVIVRWAKQTRRWVAADTALSWVKAPQTSRVLIGAMPFYGIPTDANHVGILVRADSDYLCNIEGNTSSNGYSRNGTLCDYKDASLTRLIGFALPAPLA